MNRFITTFMDWKEQIINFTFGRIQISFLSILFAVLMAVPLAMIIGGQKGFCKIIRWVIEWIKNFPLFSKKGLFYICYGAEDANNKKSDKVHCFFSSVFVLVVALVCTGCFSVLRIPTNHIIIAGKMGTEPEILINMYKILIEKHTDLKVDIKPNYGSTLALYEALKSGKIDIYPEFSGTITSTLLKKLDFLLNEPRKVYETARDLIYEQDKLVYLEPMEYQNTYGIAIRREFSEKFNIYTISDLKDVQNSVSAGFSPEFSGREDGNIGLKKLYNLNLNVKIMERRFLYDELDKRHIQVIEVFSTDSALKKHNLVVLLDDKGMFPPYQGGPLLREETLKEHPKLKEVLERLAGKITAEEMSEMNYAVDRGGRTAYDVAYDYLQLCGEVE